jgi:hypothetical protein
METPQNPQVNTVSEKPKWQTLIGEPEFLATVKEIAAKLSYKFRFDIHNMDDITQQCYIFAMDALNRYKPEVGPIAPFLYTHLKNRLVNFKRDQTLRKTPNRQEVHENIEEGGLPPPLIDKDQLDSILERIPVEYRSDVYRLIDGVKIPKSRYSKIKAILEQMRAEETT